MTLANLKAICAGATPGPWVFNSYSEVAQIQRYWGGDEFDIPWVARVPVVAGDTATEQGAIDAKHIATFNPQLVLAMLEIIEASMGMREDGYNDGVIQTYDTKRAALDEMIRGMR